jgi:hypothetical protein
VRGQAGLSLSRASGPCVSTHPQRPRRCRRSAACGRPISKADIKRFGDAFPPEGPILAVRVADLGEKEAVLAAQPGAFFTVLHFDGYSAVLIQLKKVSRAALREAIIGGWLACAPTRIVDQYLGR